MTNKTQIKTNYPIALTSRDHLIPRGTKNDNSRNLRFNNKIAVIKPYSISILDLGCAGGAMVKSFIDQGHFAIGLEGSDYSLNRQRAEWATIPEYLFTTDISKPFQVFVNDKPHKFDLITAWEFLEHIEEKDLSIVFQNINKHLLNDGLFIVSISWNEEFHHRTLHPLIWWKQFIEQFGFYSDDELLATFLPRDFVRRGVTSEFSHLIIKKS